MSTTIPKIKLGTWSWDAGAARGDQVFGNHLFKEELKPVFEKSLVMKRVSIRFGNGKRRCRL